jgi:hypothetical protein
MNNRPAPKTLRRRFFVALGHAIHLTWPVLLAVLALQLALGLPTGFVESWSLGDAVYFTFITGLTIGYGDLGRVLTKLKSLSVSRTQSMSASLPAAALAPTWSISPSDLRWLRQIRKATA